QPPVAVDDHAVTSKNTAVTVDVLANDSDVDGDTLTVSITSGPAHGTASVSSNHVVYTPTTGFVGQDEVVYSISDGHGGTATANQATGVIVRETSGQGFVTSVVLIDTSNVEHTIWSGTDPAQDSGGPVDLIVRFPQTSYNVAKVKVNVDTDHAEGTSEEIDA